MWPIKDEFEENVVVVSLLKEIDTVLNLKSCELEVFFQPDRFLADKSKIMNFKLHKVVYKTQNLSLRNYSL